MDWLIEPIVFALLVLGVWTLWDRRYGGPK
jgi:hypothetical protein